MNLSFKSYRGGEEKEDKSAANIGSCLEFHLHKKSATKCDQS